MSIETEPFRKPSMGDLDKLSFHEEIEIGDGWWAMKVLGGFIYTYIDSDYNQVTSTFVPRNIP